MTSATCLAESAPDITTLVDPHANGYAGEVSAEAAYAFLKAKPGVLVDVRTQPEWQFTGVADLRNTPSEMLLISWKTYPQFQLNPEFTAALSAEIPAKTTPIFFICRSGGRSLDAAVEMTSHGYEYCFNVTGGFEGEPDASGKRCIKEGWKASHLPWAQS